MSTTCMPDVILVIQCQKANVICLKIRVISGHTQCTRTKRVKIRVISGHTQCTRTKRVKLKIITANYAANAEQRLFHPNLYPTLNRHDVFFKM